MNDQARRHSPAAERNRGPILEQLQRLLPARGLMLEIASGSGQHAAFFAAALPGWQWQPSDGDSGSLASIQSWCEGLPNVRVPIPLDVMAGQWAGAPAPVDAVFCANLLHIAPWPVCAALMAGAARHLAPGGRLLLYGPYFEDARAGAEQCRVRCRPARPRPGLGHPAPGRCAGAGIGGGTAAARTPRDARQQPAARVRGRRLARARQRLAEPRGAARLIRIRFRSHKNPVRAEPFDQLRTGSVEALPSTGSG